MLYFSIQNRRQDRTGKVSEAAGARWQFYPRISSDIGYRRISSDIVGLCSNRLYIGGSNSGFLRWNHELQEFRGRRSIWWGWRVALLAARIGNDVSYVMQITDDDSFCVAGAVFGEAGVWLFVAGAAFGEGGVWLFVAGAALCDSLGDSRSAKCCILQYKIVSKMGRVRSPKRRVRDDNFMLGLSSNIVGYRRISSDYPRIVFILAEALEALSPEILSFKISWQVQYLVKLEGDFACSAHWKWRFICDADHWWHWFCVAGAVFGEVGGWLLVAGAAHRDILGDSRSAKCCILQYKIVSKMGRVRSPKRRVRDDNFMLGLCSDYARIIVESSLYGRKHFRHFYLRSTTSRFRGRRSIWWGWRVTLLAPRIGNDVSYVTRITHEIHFAWQAQHLVKLAAASCEVPE